MGEAERRLSSGGSETDDELCATSARIQKEYGDMAGHWLDENYLSLSLHTYRYDDPSRTLSHFFLLDIQCETKIKLKSNIEINPRQLHPGILDPKKLECRLHIRSMRSRLYLELRRGRSHFVCPISYSEFRISASKSKKIDTLTDIDLSALLGTGFDSGSLLKSEARDALRDHFSHDHPVHVRHHPQPPHLQPPQHHAYRVRGH